MPTNQRSLFQNNKLTVYMVHQLLEQKRKMTVKTEPEHQLPLFYQLQSQSFYCNRKQQKQHSTTINSSSDSDIPWVNLHKLQKDIRDSINEEEDDYKICKNTNEHKQGKLVNSIKKQHQVKRKKEPMKSESMDLNQFLIQSMRKYVSRATKEEKQLNNNKTDQFGLNIKKITSFSINDRKKLVDGKWKRVVTCDRKKAVPRQGVKEISIQSVEMKSVASIDQHSLSRKKLPQPALNRTNASSKPSLPVQKKLTLLQEEKKDLLQQKRKIMKRSLNIILNAYHCYLANTDLQEEAKKTRQIWKSNTGLYKYFVGAGNNRNLIRSIFKKRSWWTETEEVASANFVWTQLQIQEVTERIQTVCEDPNVVYYEDQLSLVPLSQELSKKVPPIDPEKSRLFHPRQDRRYHEVLGPQAQKRHLGCITPPKQLHNHIECNYTFNNKSSLLYHMVAYCEFQCIDVWSMLPLSYYLEIGNSRTCKQFQRVHAQAQKKNTIWIIKPAQNSNRGQNITVTTSLADIKLQLSQLKKIIVQKYLKQVMLYNGRKFDIRTYVFANSINNVTKYYWYSEGYIRTSSSLYSLNDLQDNYIHLTNDAIQNTCDTYGRYQLGNKISFKEFQRYLDSYYREETYKMENLNARMKAIARETVRAISCRADPNHRQCSMELFGLDFLVDRQFTPYLLEINTNPCLQLSAPCLERMIPRMMENLIRIAVDPLYRPIGESRYYKSQPQLIYPDILTTNKFQLIFDSQFDRNFDWEEKCNNLRGMEWTSDEQTFEDEGKIITIDN